ncbi:MAG: prolipoprotein diacylglyceryl transferase [Candidatus Izemoplasma sp.]
MFDHTLIEPLSDIFFDLGFIVWYKYSFMILLGMFFATVLGLREGKKLGISSDEIFDGVLIIIPLSIVGARLYYVIFEWSRFSGDLMKILDIRSGGLAIHGGIIVGFVGTYIYCKIRGINIFRALDLVAPGFLVAQASGRWGNFFNQEAHGGVIGGVDEVGNVILSLDDQRAFLADTLHLPTFITDNMYLKGPDAFSNQYYHPTFLYESMWNLLGLGILFWLRRTKFLRTGDLVAFYMMWYSFGRFFIESMRTDSLYVGNTGLRTAQIISILLFLGGIAFLVLNRVVIKSMHYYKALEENAL